MGPLSGGARGLLSGPLQSGVCFLRDPLPAVSSHALQLAYLIGRCGQEDNGFTEFHDSDMGGMGAASLPTVLYQRVPNEEQDIRSRAFWLRRVRLFSPVHLNGSCSS